MSGANVSTIQLEIDVSIVATLVHVICMTAGFMTSIEMIASIPRC